MFSLIGVAILSAIVGTALDRLHLLFGALTYPYTTQSGQAAFVPFVMAVGGIGVVFGHRILVRLRGGMATSVGLGKVLTYLTLFVLAYAATAWFHNEPTWLAIGLVVAFVPVLGGHPYSGFALHCVLAAVLGTAFEATLVGRGWFSYMHPDFKGVPMWLPALYLWAAALGAQCDRFLHTDRAIKKAFPGVGSK